MPTPKTVRKAKAALRRGKSPNTAAGEFVREEIEHVRHGKHGARSPEQAIAIGLSKARRAGVPLKKKPARRRRPAVKKTSRQAVSKKALGAHAKRVAKRRGTGGAKKRQK